MQNKKPSLQLDLSPTDDEHFSSNCEDNSSIQCTTRNISTFHSSFSIYHVFVRRLRVCRDIFSSKHNISREKKVVCERDLFKCNVTQTYTHKTKVYVNIFIDKPNICKKKSFFFPLNRDRTFFDTGI